MVVERSGNLTYPKKLMIYLGFPTEPEKTEARRTDFSRYFRQLDNPDYIPRAHDKTGKGGISAECNECGIRTAECGSTKFRGPRAPCESMIFEKKSG